MVGEASSTYTEGQEQLEKIAEEGIADGRFARNRFLKVLGAGLFGSAVALLLPNPKLAEAYCGSSAPCEGGELCCGGCCVPNKCDPHCNQGWLGCKSGEQCWYTCSAGGKHIKCCDCWDINSFPVPCICRFNVGTC